MTSDVVPMDCNPGPVFQSRDFGIGKGLGSRHRGIAIFPTDNSGNPGISGLGKRPGCGIPGLQSLARSEVQKAID